MNTSSSNFLNTSSTYMHGYLSSLASNPANGTAAGGPSVSQSMVFYDKSRHHEQEVHDLKKEVPNIRLQTFIVPQKGNWGW